MAHDVESQRVKDREHSQRVIEKSKREIADAEETRVRLARRLEVSDERTAKAVKVLRRNRLLP